MRIDLPEHRLDEACGALAREGHAVVAGLFTDAMLPALAADAHALHTGDRLRPARVGPAGRRRRVESIRSDRIFWLDPAPDAPVRAAFLDACDALRLALNRRLLLGLDTLEAHYAVYPPGARYRRHRDCFQEDDTRVLSLTVYLNADWREGDGGALRLYLPGGHVDVPPLAGTSVLFLADEVEHEVLPSLRPRYSIAGWFRRRPIGNALPPRDA